MIQKISNISSTVSFVDVVASQYLEQYAGNPAQLADMLILMPNRRSVQNLKEAFVRAQGDIPTILPQIVAMSDLEEDEIFLSDMNKDDVNEILPAVGKIERRFLFARIIQKKPSSFGLERFSALQSSVLADELSKLIDEVNNSKLDFARLNDLVPEEYAAHWQDTLEFLKIITEYWPKELKERKLTDASAKHNLLLNMKSRQWQEEKPKRHIVAAGIYADYPEIKQLLKTISRLENGEIIINGLDRNLSEKEWNDIEESHPQYQLKRLLEALEVKREDVEERVPSMNKERERLVSETMRPSQNTDEWLKLNKKPFLRETFDGLRIVQCDDLHNEAVSVALIIREKLAQEGQTVALVSPDRKLSRMVMSELERWNIVADDSAGKPLHLQPVAVYLRQVFDAVLQNYSAVPLLSLLKNPFCLSGKNTAEFRKEVRNFETNILRAKKLDITVNKNSEFFEEIKGKLLPLELLVRKKTVGLKELMHAHLTVAEELASTAEAYGAKVLWRGEDGSSAAGFFADVLEKADIFGDINPEEYLEFLENLMSSVSVRKQYGTHPRLKILGPVEARLNGFDTIIIAEANEGTWPPSSSADPWMSRPMKKKFGLPLSDKNAGIFAFDFANLLSQEDVYITRAQKVDGSPTNKSRWLLRLEAVTQASGYKASELYAQEYSVWAKLLDASDTQNRLEEPSPCPDLKYRPRNLSASALQTLIDNPYNAYAKYILKLYPSEGLDAEFNAGHYGTIIHEMFETFIKKYKEKMPENAREKYLEIGQKLFEKYGVEENKRIFWQGRMEKAIDWVLAEEENERIGIIRPYPEKEGKIVLPLPGGDFTLTAKADRIDEFKGNKLTVIDYKTGRNAPTKKAVETFNAPQLILEALIAQNGGYEGIKGKTVDKLSYWNFKGKPINIDEKVEDLLEKGLQKYKELLNKYDFEEMPYRVKRQPKNGIKDDYEHLSRIREWGVYGEEDDD